MCWGTSAEIRGVKDRSGVVVGGATAGFRASFQGKVVDALNLLHSVCQCGNSFATSDCEIQFVKASKLFDVFQPARGCASSGRKVPCLIRHMHSPCIRVPLFVFERYTPRQTRTI